MIKRQLYNQLEKHLAHKEMTLLTGPRQAGKTTLMMRLKKELEAKGERTAFFNLDIEADMRFFDTQDHFLRKIALEIGKRGYVFIDEIQRKADAGVFLKGIYDMNLPYKFIVSGSGALELKEKIHESLAGRKQIFELTTVNFSEFVHYKTQYAYEQTLTDFYSLEPDKVQSFFEEYLCFGGYPKVVLAPTLEEKRAVMAELYQSYLERDIVGLLGIQKSEHFTALVRLLAGQVGKLANVAELSRTLGMSAITVNTYLWYMQKTFLVERVTPFFKNIRKELVKAPVFYFSDLGMRNYAAGIFGVMPGVEEGGFLFQNFVYHLLRMKRSDAASRIHYWRTKDNAEVDFVLDEDGGVVPVEVKYRSLAGPEMTRSYVSFLSSYHPHTGYIVHLGAGTYKKTVGGTDVVSLPYFRLQ